MSGSEGNAILKLAAQLLEISDSLWNGFSTMEKKSEWSLSSQQTHAIEEVVERVLEDESL